MKLYRNIKLSVKALLINRSRTVFSILGMAVGIAAVIVTVAIGDAAKKKALKPIKAMGTNVLLVNSGKSKLVFGRKKQISRVKIPSRATHGLVHIMSLSILIVDYKLMIIMSINYVPI